MTASILVTGFEPFEGLASNPSGQVAEAVAGENVTAAILPVSDRAAPRMLEQLLEREWDAVLLLGVAPDRLCYSLERVALNYRDPDRPDNEDHTPDETWLVKNGPAAYFSTLPLDQLLTRLQGDNHPAEISMSAGAYLCNAVFYLARHQLADGPPCGFLHLPPTPGLCGDQGIALENQIRAISTVLEELTRPDDPVLELTP